MPIIRIGNGIDDLLPVGVSDLGTLVSDNVVFPERPGYPEIRFDNVTISVNMQKEIIRTKISTVRGEFKEYTSTGDYDVNITALVTEPLISNQTVLPFGSLFPSERLFNYHRLFKVNDVVPVRCKYLNNILDINNLVILDTSISKDTPDTYAINIKALSDFDFDFGDFG